MGDRDAEEHKSRPRSKSREGQRNYIAFRPLIFLPSHLLFFSLVCPLLPYIPHRAHDRRVTGHPRAQRHLTHGGPD